jgi:outer membrane protein
LDREKGVELIPNRRFLLMILGCTFPLWATVENLTLDQAIKIVRSDNLELEISRFEEQMKAHEVAAVRGMHLGKLDVTLNAMRSNDALNVFGFKLMSREANFGDFGFSDFLGGIGMLMQSSSGDFSSFAQMLSDPAMQSQMLSVEPEDLNYPEARNHYQTKLTYQIPLYTGGKLTEYGRIARAMHQMSTMDTEKLTNSKIYQVQKAFYDIALVDAYIVNLQRITKNISKLEDVVKAMQKEGYAKQVDLLEVQARAAEASSLYNQARLNRDLAYQFLSFLLNQEVESIRGAQEMAPMPVVRLNALYRDNIDIQQAMLGYEITQMAVKAERANFLPMIGGFGEYGSADNTIFEDFGQKDSYTFGVQLSWNLFNGGVDKANLERAKLKRLQLQQQVELAKKGIALKASQLKTEALSLDADVKSYQTQFAFASRVYENYQERYREGVVSISDLLIKQSMQLETLLKLQTAKNKRNTKIFELNSLMNKEVNL